MALLFYKRPMLTLSIAGRLSGVNEKTSGTPARANRPAVTRPLAALTGGEGNPYEGGEFYSGNSGNLIRN
ncbi:Hypothetical protein NTJ_03957 [Nesidiocoris tenuis]|uniref:Uncharacterized protein n=1 Tax=Nesidiocoris tenuis TaxID=355587 RepID=A0ABN7AGR2_9HEMI|nr:Hypothetical protein NTJ_03957 [Nesidiocoris tenuis]